MQEKDAEDFNKDKLKWRTIVTWTKGQVGWEFPLWLSGLMTCVCDDVGSIPWLTQWVKDQALPQAVA